MNSSNVTLTDCEFTDNSCEGTGGAYAWLQNALSPQPSGLYQQTIKNTTFRNNTAKVKVRGRSLT